MEIKTFYENKVKEITEPSIVDMEKRTITHWITTDAVDADSEVILPMGVKLERYLKNPVVLRNHDNTMEGIIGNNISLEQTEKGIKATTYILPKPEGYQGNWAGDLILWLYAKGHAKSWSIGFCHGEGYLATAEDKKKYGNKAEKIITSVELGEYSAVAVPSNPEAVLSFKSYSPEFATYLKSGKPLDKDSLEKELKPKVKKIYPVGHLNSLVKENIEKRINEKTKKVITWNK